MNTKDSATEGKIIPLFPDEPRFPAGVDRRSFLVRHAIIGAAAVMAGKTWTPEARAQQAANEAAEPKMGAKTSTYDFYQRCTKLPC